ncbi:CotH kinase family protein [Neobacillus vireti]|uniref:Spore coat protein H n=1 Tax=Neobacillus vireti LMG 21834 TaxID=1131730 RepID=A0AB94IH55_9BACI|nr:CotH kinase family protein [Neobacillus vireti]ETI66448.1 spore coat protein H [Neobacillus vireti LMG 21834]KLT15876.1 spore coat protein [Neobacillus vireti]
MQKYEIFINPKQLNQLDKDIWMDKHVPAVLKIGSSQYKIGLSYRGNVIRKKKKKSYNIVFQKPFTVNGAHEIHLNAEFNDITLCRNKLSLDFFENIGVSAPHSKHILLYINGYCKGIYLELESFDQYLLEKRKLPLGPIIYATNYHANFSIFTPEKELKKSLDDGYTLKYGEKKDLANLENLITMTNTLSNEEFEKQIPMILDVKQYLTWLAGVVCTQNFDGFIHNYALYQNSETGVFKITPWDYDGTWGRDLHGQLLDHDFIPITGYNTLTGRLMFFPQFKKDYCDILSSTLANEFTVETQTEKIDVLFQTIVPYLHLDPFVKATPEIFNQEKELIIHFIKKRNAYLKQQMIKLQ